LSNGASQSRPVWLRPLAARGFPSLPLQYPFWSRPFPHPEYLCSSVVPAAVAVFLCALCEGSSRDPLCGRPRRRFRYPAPSESVFVRVALLQRAICGSLPVVPLLPESVPFSPNSYLCSSVFICGFPRRRCRLRRPLKRNNFFSDFRNFQRFSLRSYLQSLPSFRSLWSLRHRQEKSEFCPEKRNIDALYRGPHSVDHSASSPRLRRRLSPRPAPEKGQSLSFVGVVDCPPFLRCASTASSDSAASRPHSR